MWESDKKFDLVMEAAECLGVRTGLRPSAVYEWAKKHRVDIVNKGFKLEANPLFHLDVINDTTECVGVAL